MKISLSTTISLTEFSIRIFILLVGFGRNARGFTIDNTINGPGFNSLLDLQNHYLKADANAENKPNLSKWHKWTNAEISYDSSNRFKDEILEHEKRRLQLQNSSLEGEHPTLFNRKYVHHLVGRYGGKRGKPSSQTHSGIDELVISKEKAGPSVQFWSKRDTKAQTVPRTTNNNGNEAKNKRAEKYAMMDNTLEKLQPDPRCADNIGLCAKIPLKKMECILHCQLSTHALSQSSTKFLFRLLKVYASYPKVLCPTFGRIYNEIPSILNQRQHQNSLTGFLAGVGIVDQAPVNIDFIKISPSSLFNNLVKFGQGEDLGMVKSILDTAETAATVQLSERNFFPSIYGNPLCKLAPKEGWFASMIDAMTKHPTLTDIFLRGYWILTRALSLDLQYPLDGLFVSLVYSIKLMAGVDCSIIAYAEQGKPFKCHQPPPIDDILDDYSQTSKDDDDDNAYSWVVCGAHQVEIPEWIQNKEGLNGRSDVSDLRESNSTYTDGEKLVGTRYDDLDVFPNPDEMYSTEKK